MPAHNTKQRLPAPAKLHIERYWTHEGVHPFDEVSWELRTALIGNERGETIFEQRDVEVPAAWGQLAVNIVVSKYFRGHPGAPDRETSVRQVIERVVNTITGFAASDGLFASTTDEVAFHDELAWLVLHQRMAFNSPVWFNIGHRTNPQSSACFISPVEDSMEGIMALARTEAMLFKGGSGSGSNLSCLRAQGERLSGGGESSGPLSWMRGYDAFAGAIRSGGATRRAAKIVLLDDDHPDVMAFAGAKAHEEDKALALIREGYDSSYTGEAYASVEYQNANLSVRVTDAFMNAVESDSDWQLKGRVDHRLDSKIKAHDLLRKMAEGAWRCGDPGIQFDTTINSWHTCPASGRINASNPCSEFLFVDGSACNLASINLLSFGDSEGTFDVEGFRHAVDLTIIAQESLVDHSSYPAPVFAERSHALRPLGIGYANLGALLMARGLAYDSDAGRAVAATITAIMGGEAYAQSARIAAVRGSFAEFDINREAMMSVIERHNAAAFALDTVDAPGYMRQSAIDVWHEALALGKEHGYRNAQTSLAPPTGTISFMMGCDTTGVEPAVALVSYKKLVGEGYLKMVSGTVSAALHTLGYNAEQTSGIERYIDEHDTIEGAPGLRPEHLPVFDCAIRPQSGSRSISIDGHIKMMAAIQPFLSGAISKTVNLPEDATVDDIERVFVQSWKLGIKAIAVYRDNCKHSQPLSTKRSSGEINESQVGADEVERKIRDLEAALKTTSDALHDREEKDSAPSIPVPIRRRLPADRASRTHKFSIAGTDGYITAGLYPDNTVGEVFLTIAKEGSIASGFANSWATAVSVALQYGAPLSAIIAKFHGVRFDPMGFTGNDIHPLAMSIVDYVANWLAVNFLTPEERATLGLATKSQPALGLPSRQIPIAVAGEVTAPSSVSGEIHIAHLDMAPPWADEAPPPSPEVIAAAASGAEGRICHRCGSSRLVRTGVCFTCDNCGDATSCG